MRRHPVCQSAAQLRLILPSRLEAIDPAERLAGVLLEHLGLPDVDRDRAVLAVREALANAITHGSGLAADSSVECELAVESTWASGDGASGDRASGDQASGDQKTLIVRVSDRGEGFDPSAVPDPLAPENLTRRSGRGILLMKSFMDQVEFSFPGTGGTIVTMGKRVPST